MSNGMVKQHRIASYNKGCKCDRCREARRASAASHRRRARIAAGASHPCPMCGDVFLTEHGMRVHETVIHG